jgi:transcriptional regulator with XRE-family HTH domain
MKVKKISRKELLLRSKIPPSTLSTILRGVHKPGLVTLSRLSRGLGVSLGRVANSWRAG